VARSPSDRRWVNPWRRPLRTTDVDDDRLGDETLLAGLGTGDAQIALAFVQRFQRRVFGVAISVLGDRMLAEDVAQQTFERAWRHAAVYDPRRGSVKTWLSTIAHNLAIDVIRTRRPEVVDPVDLVGLLGAVTDTPERHALAADDSRRLRSALRELPLEQGRALVMAGILGMTARQIAETERIPLGTAKTRIRTAMEKLRVTLAPLRAHDD
jgi:RNA polymerase sigma factor (sigma-70 family)